MVQCLSKFSVRQFGATSGGGFILMPTAAPINVPLSPATEENYRAFIEAGLEFGGY